MIGKQFSDSEFFQAGGHHILMVRKRGGISFCVVDQDGSGCTGKAKHFSRKELESVIAKARGNGNTSIDLVVPSRCVNRGKIKTTEETITFQCRFLLLHLRRLR